MSNSPKNPKSYDPKPGQILSLVLMIIAVSAPLGYILAII